MQGKRARLRGALLVVLVALVLLPLGMAHQRGVAGAHEQADAPVQLEVALVNEDVGTVVGGEDLNLGRSFITQVENDADAHWWVVSRCVAEGGLADGRYQLMLVIPADFSAALASLDSAAPERVGITYQVNGDGNVRTEALATGMGEGLVARLDQQLVDMYVAAVLDNLRQAQENVRLLVEARDTTTQEYQIDLPPAVAGLSTDLAALAEASLSAADAAAGHVDALDAGAVATSVLAADGAVHGTSLADLVAARDRGALTSAQFSEALMVMDGEVLGEHVQALYDELVRVGDALAEQLAASTPEGSHGDDLARLGAALTQVRRTVADRQDVLEALDEQQVLDVFRAAVYSVLDTDRSGSVSLAEVAAASSGQGAVIDGDLRRAAEAQIAGLPYRSALDLGTAVAAGDLSYAQGAVGGSAGQIGADLAALEGWDGYAEVAEDLGGVARADLAAAIADLQAAEQAFAQQAVQAAAPDPSSQSHAVGGEDVEAVDDGALGGIEAAATGVPAADDLAAAAARYGSVVSRIRESYAHAVQLVTLMQQCATSCGAEVDASTAVDDVLVRAVVEQVRTEQVALGDVADRVGESEAVLSDVTGSYQHLVTTSDELSANIEAQLAQLAALRQALAGVHAGQALITASEAERSAAIDRTVGEGVGLLASSEMLAASSRSAVDQAAAGLSPDELRTSAERYGNGADEIQDILSSLSREQGIIRDNWEGTAFDSFDEQFSELSPQIQKFADLLQDIREQLRSIAGIVEQTDADIASQLRR